MTRPWYRRVHWTRVGLLLALSTNVILAAALARVSADDGEPVLELYEVSDLIDPPDFPVWSHPDPVAQDMSAGVGGVLSFPDDDWAPLDADTLVELLESKLDGRGSIACRAGTLIVNRPRSDQAQVSRILRALREAEPPR